MSNHEALGCSVSDLCISSSTVASHIMLLWLEKKLVAKLLDMSKKSLILCRRQSCEFRESNLYTVSDSMNKRGACSLGFPYQALVKHVLTCFVPME